MKKKKEKKNKKKKNIKIDKSILEWLPFKEVWNDLLFLDNDKVVGIIKVNSINLQLFSNEEQTSKIFQFRKVLLSLEYPFKILALDKPVSLSEHIENLLYLSSCTDDIYKRKLLEEDIKYADNIMSKNLVNNREFYLIIDEDKDNVKLLKSKINDIVSQLNNIGLVSTQAKTNEIKELLFTYLNPTSSLEIFKQDSSLKSLKEKIAPIAMKFEDKDLLLGDCYATSIIIDTFPSYTRSSWLGMLSNIKNTRMMITVNPIDNIEVNKTLKKGMTETRSKYINSKDRNEQIILKNQLEDYENLTNKIDRENEKMLLLSVVFFTYAETKEELQKRIKEIKSALSSLNLRGSQLIFEQEQGLINCLPTLESPLQNNFGLPMPTTTVAASFPFVFESMQDDGNSIILGDDINGGLTLFDIWKRNNKRTNSNMCIIGKSGSGKSTLIKKLIRGNFARGGGHKKTKILVIDPEREYKDLCLNLNGNWIDCGSGSGFVINPLEIKNSATDEDNGIAVIKHIQTFRTFIKYYFKDLSELELTKLEELLLRTYKNKNITLNTNVSKLTSKDYPTITDFHNEIVIDLDKAKSDKRINDDNVKSLEKIEAIVRRMTTGVDSKLWNDYTNIDLNSDFIVFDIHTLLDSDDTILRTQFFNILSLCWHIISENRDEQVILIVDEAHLLIDPENKDGLEFLKRTSKRIRKYNGSLIVCTQNMIDFTSPEVVRYGQVIVDNSDYQIVMAQGSEEIISLQKVLRLSDNERRFLQTAGKGQALFVITHEKRIPIFIHLRPEEKELFGKGGGR